MEVNKRSIEAFFSDASVNRKKIIIPDYQRSYAWNKENVEILFEDLVKFSGIYNENTNRRYFLGNILYIVKDNEIQIIDGQQRITMNKDDGDTWKEICPIQDPSNDGYDRRTTTYD